MSPSIEVKTRHMTEKRTYKIKRDGQELEIELYLLDRVEELKERVRTGNGKLNKAWEVICKIDHESQRWNDAVQEWHLANERLSAYCEQLKNMGVRDCLYIKDGKKYKDCLDDLGCRVCPSIVSYWERELMDLPSGSDQTEMKV